MSRPQKVLTAKRPDREIFDREISDRQHKYTKNEVVHKGIYHLLYSSTFF